MKLGYFMFFVFLLIGLFVQGNYGAVGDETLYQRMGEQTYDYITGKSQTTPNKGIFFELLLIFFQKIFSLTDNGDIYNSRHLITHFFYLVGGLFSYRLVYLLYSNVLLSALAFFCIIAAPRLYAHSFVNSRDPIFLAFYMITLYYIAKAFQKEQLSNYIWLGILTAVVTNIRPVGIFLDGLIGLALCFDLFFNKKVEKLFILKKIGVFITAYIITLIMTWPILWEDTIHSFSKAILLAFDKNPLIWGIIFEGKYIESYGGPWYYHLWWFFSTTPIISLLLGLSGMAFFIYIALKRLKDVPFDLTLKMNTLFFISLCTPYTIDALTYSATFDGWRHMHFTYGSFILLGIFFLSQLIKNGHRKIVIGFASLAFLLNAYATVNFHPFQYLYFNEFANTKSEYLRKNYSGDYWSISQKLCFKEILKRDTSEWIPISATSRLIGLYTLPPEERKRFYTVADPSIAKYYISNNRYLMHKPRPNSLYFNVRVNNNNYVSVYKFY